MREEKKVFIFLLQDMFRVLAANREIGCALVGPHGDIAFVRRIENFLEQYSRHVRGDMLPEQLAEMKYFYFILLEWMSGICENMAGRRRG